MQSSWYWLLQRTLGYRAAEANNIIIHGLWLVVFACWGSTWIEVRMPPPVYCSTNTIAWLASAAVASTWIAGHISVLCDSIPRIGGELQKTFKGLTKRLRRVALLFGSLTQSFIAVNFIAMYPPLESNVVLGGVLASWFAITAIFEPFNDL